jgi:hypothetical protein
LGSSGREVGYRLARLGRDPALVIVTFTGLVHFVRGAPLDGVIFIGVSLVLAVSELAVARERPADPGPPELSAEPPPPIRRVGTTEAIAVLLGSVLFGILVGSWIRFSVPVEVAMVAVGVLSVGAVWRQSPGPADGQLPESQPLGWGALAWVALALTWCGWELVSFVHEVNVDDVSIGHPTLSDIVEPVLDHRVARWIALTAWVAAGYGLVRTGRRAVRR